MIKSCRVCGIQTDTTYFDYAERLSHQFNWTGSKQFLPTVKPKSHGGKSSIEDTIIDILNESIASLSCPFTLLEEIPEVVVRKAGDNDQNLCYSCGRPPPPKKKHQQANRFVFGSPSQRLQSGGSQTQPPVCGECLTVAFACPVKLTSGAIIVKLAPNDQTDQSFSIENHLRMLTLGEFEPNCRTVFTHQVRRFCRFNARVRKDWTKAVHALASCLYISHCGIADNEVYTICRWNRNSIGKPALCMVKPTQ